MVYSQMWDMKFCGCCATVSEVWCFWPGASRVASETELAVLLREVQQALPAPIHGVISDGQHAIRNAVHSILPEVPHQLCHFHYLHEAAKPIYEADRHAKKELKKHICGVRPIERALEHRQDGEAEVIRGYCLAVRSALDF
jgi:Transposase, Mutator family